MANLFSATQRPEVASATPPATKILGARDQNRYRGPDFGEQLENAKRDRPEPVARDRHSSTSQPERHERRDSEPRTQANNRDDRAEHRREADRSEQNSSRANEARDRTDDDTRSQNSDANADERESAGDESNANSQDTAQSQQTDDQADTSATDADGTTPVDAFADAVITALETEDALSAADTNIEGDEILPVEGVVNTTQSQTDPALLGRTADAAAVAQATSFVAASSGLTQRPGELGAVIPGTPMGQTATPTDQSNSEPSALAGGDEFLEGGTSKQEVQGDRAFERALAARNALSPNENRGANAFQAASAVRGDATAVDPATLPVGSTPQGQSGAPSTVIRMVPAATIGQASTVPVHTMAFHIARNIDNGVNRFEIRVDPPELGRLDVTMEVQSDGKVRVHMVVERAEALDFLQRDARALEKALADAGLDADSDSVSFSLEQNDQDANSGQNEEFDATDTNGHGDDNEPTEIPVSGTPRQYLSATGVDIRI